MSLLWKTEFVDLQQTKFLPQPFGQLPYWFAFRAAHAHCHSRNAPKSLLRQRLSNHTAFYHNGNKSFLLDGWWSNLDWQISICFVLENSHSINSSLIQKHVILLHVWMYHQGNDKTPISFVISKHIINSYSNWTIKIRYILVDTKVVLILCALPCLPNKKKSKKYW